MAWIGAALVLSHSLGTGAAWGCRENAMIVFDASGSMARHRDGLAKIEIARRAAAAVLPGVTRYRPTGLVTYGGIDGPACRDVTVRVEPEANSARRIVAALGSIPPLGPTALTAGVRMAADVLRERGVPGIIVLITDGLESCGGKACELARGLRADGGDIRVHVISFYLEGGKVETLKCLTEETDGTYAAADSLEALSEELRRLLSCLRLSKARDMGSTGREP